MCVKGRKSAISKREFGRYNAVAYDFPYSMAKKDGKNVLHFTIKQSGVSEKFKTPVPINLEFPNGNVAKLGFVAMQGNSTKEQDVAVGEVVLRKVMINYNSDVLSAND